MGGGNFAFDDVKNMLSELHLSDDALSQIEMFLETQANVAFDEIIQSKLRLPHKELRERLPVAVHTQTYSSRDRKREGKCISGGTCQSGSSC